MTKQTRVELLRRWGRPFLAALLLAFVLGSICTAGAVTIQVDPEGAQGMGAIQLLFLFTLIALGPSLLIMMTCFTRIVIVFSFLRSAIGLQQTPPNQVIIGLSLFLSLFIMFPVLSEVNDKGLDPYLNGEITQEAALENMSTPMKIFMLKNINVSDLNLFLSLAGEESALEEITPDALTDLGLHIIVPAFITSELKRAFTIGFLLYLPFLVIDMVVSSTLMSMGMVMLPPSMISLPFKLMLFVVVDGWGLLIKTLASSFFL